MTRSIFEDVRETCKGYGSLLPSLKEKGYHRYSGLGEEEKHLHHFEDELDEQEHSTYRLSRVRISQRPPWQRQWALLGVMILVGASILSIRSLGHRDTGVDKKSFDYIVVGGGPSGIIAATKLARGFPDLRVLLLESGTTSQSSVLASLRASSLPKSSSVDSRVGWQDDGVVNLNKFDIPLMWSGAASSQGRLNLLEGDREFWSNHHWPIRRTLLARALGGCGVHNAMINVRSLPVDIERWNLTGWTFDNILEHYKLMETYVDSDWEQPPFWKDQEPQQNKPWRGHLGAVHTVPAGPSIDPVASLFVQSCVNSGIGLSKTQGFNDPEASARIGAGYYEFNIHNGVRDSIAAAFLGGQGGSTSSVPKNLKIRTGATVTHVVSQDAHGGGKPRAVGVHFVARKGSSEFVKLEDPKGLSEIILAAGAIITPQILTNSGIGEDGSVVDLPGVGKNLHDHPVVAMTLRLTPNIIEGSSSIYTVGVEMEDYLTSVTELMTMVEDTGGNFTRTARQRAHEQIATLGTPGFSAGAFLRSPWATDEAPDIQLTVFPRSIEPHVARKERREDTKSMRASAMVITVALLRPDARYEVRPSTTTSTTAVGSSTKQKSPIQATKSDMLPLDGNPLTQQLHFHLPSIDLPEAREQYLSDLDVERLAWGLEQVRLIGKTAPLADNTVEEIYPGPEADLQAFVRGNHLPNSHWVGSTKMGIDKDHMAVLDEALRVRGIDNLRVVDSGAIPKIPNGNIHSTVCAVASHAADMIITRRQERGERQRR